MRLRLEPVVFLLTLLLLGWWSFDLVRPKTSARRRDRSSTEAEMVEHAAPPVALALGDESLRTRGERELFSPPRDTHRLPLLDPVEPPFAALPALLPPTAPGPAPRAYGALLRTELVVEDSPGLFAEVGEEEMSDEDIAFLEDSAGEVDERRSLIAAVREAEDAERPDPFADETAEERLARIQGYQERYDWILRFDGARPSFGRIENEDRYRLLFDETRADEPILFTEIDPQTGSERFTGVRGAIPLDRSGVHEFHFARSFANELEIERLRIGSRLTRGSYDPALELARRCVERRREAARALPVAEELYRLAAAFDPEDPEPRLGLAACYEAGFRFEDAFEVYQALVQDYPHRPEVHTRLALLEERFLLFETAEERLRRGVEVDRSSWEARFGLGAFLARRGRHEEAIEHLAQANRTAPQDPESLRTRVAIRNALADAHLALGDLAEARRVYSQALGAEAENAHARAGRLATALFAREAATDGDAAAPGAAEPASFELVLTRGVGDLVEERFGDARDAFRLAVETDPLRAHRAKAALSYLAEVTGHPDAALGFVEEALEVAPQDPWCLYQRGRLLAERDEYEAARASLLAALEVELDFEDALIALGDAAFRLGRFPDAERFFERAAGLAPDRSDVHALRGWNFLRLGSVPDARASFERALSIRSDDPVAMGGIAWCHYLSGDSQEALIRLADLDESRRQESDDDPYRLWAKQEIARIADHEEKVAWTDDFERKVLRNGWQTGERAGPTVAMVDGAVRLEGVFTENGSCWVRRDYPSSLFVAVEARIRIAARSNARAGLIVARERQRRNAAPEVLSEASISRHKEGGLQVRIVASGHAPQLIDMEQPFPTDEWVDLRIERTGEGSESRVTLLVQGIPLVENVVLSGLGAGASTPLQVGLFVEGETGRQVSVEMDRIEVVYRR